MGSFIPTSFYSRIELNEAEWEVSSPRQGILPHTYSKFLSDILSLEKQLFLAKTLVLPLLDTVDWIG